MVGCFEWGGVGEDGLIIRGFRGSAVLIYDRGRCVEGRIKGMWPSRVKIDGLDTVTLKGS